MTELENTNTGLHVGRAGTTVHLRLGTEAGPGLPRVGEQVGNQTRRACVATGRTAVPSRAAPRRWERCPRGSRDASRAGRSGSERGGRTKPRCQRAGGRKEKRRRWWRRGAEQVSPVTSSARAPGRAVPRWHRERPRGAVRRRAGRGRLCERRGAG